MSKQSSTKIQKISKILLILTITAHASLSVNVLFKDQKAVPKIDSVTFINPTEYLISVKGKLYTNKMTLTENALTIDPGLPQDLGIDASGGGAWKFLASHKNGESFVLSFEQAGNSAVMHTKAGQKTFNEPEIGINPFRTLVENPWDSKPQQVILAAKAAIKVSFKPGDLRMEVITSIPECEDDLELLFPQKSDSQPARFFYKCHRTVKVFDALTYQKVPNIDDKYTANLARGLNSRAGLIGNHEQLLILAESNFARVRALRITDAPSLAYSASLNLNMAGTIGYRIAGFQQIVGTATALALSHIDQGETKKVSLEIYEIDFFLQNLEIIENKFLVSLDEEPVDLLANPILYHPESKICLFFTEARKELHAFYFGPQPVVPVCQPETEFEEGGKCVKCSERYPNCEKCSKAAGCSQCKPTFLTQGFNGCSCPAGSFNIRGECKGCSFEGCQECDVVPNPFTNIPILFCKTCKADFVPFPKGNKERCVYDCQKDSKEFANDGSCVEIDCKQFGETCTGCSDNKGCILCLGGFLEDKDLGGGVIRKFCQKYCAANEARDTTTNQCLPCSDNNLRRCSTCTGISAPGEFIRCTSCDGGLQLRQKITSKDQMQCFPPPGPGECIDLEILNDSPIRKCWDDVPNCAVCSDQTSKQCLKEVDGVIQCLSCQPGFELITLQSTGKTHCMAKCKEKVEYRDEKTGQCLLCSGKLNSCHECGWKVEGGVERLRCLNCKNGFKVNPKGVLGANDPPCLKECQSGSFLTSKNTCKACSEDIEGCSACQGNPPVCQGCKNGFILRKNFVGVPNIEKVCLVDCPIGFYRNLQNKCQACRDGIKNCQDCAWSMDGKKLTCQACGTGFRKNEGKGTNEKAGYDCLKICGDRLFRNQKNECQPCGEVIDNCRKCSLNQDGALQCDVCENNFKSKIEENELESKFECLKVCESGSFRNEKNGCQKCYEKLGNCQRCSWSQPEKTLTCDACQQGFRKILLPATAPTPSLCVKRCQPGFLRDKKDQCHQCSSLVPHCSQCSYNDDTLISTSEITCSSCSDGFLYKEEYLHKFGIIPALKDKSTQCFKLCQDYEYLDPNNNCKHQESYVELKIISKVFLRKKSIILIEFDREIVLRDNHSNPMKTKLINPETNTETTLTSKIEVSAQNPKQIIITPDFQNDVEYEGDLVISPTNQKRILARSSVEQNIRAEEEKGKDFRVSTKNNENREIFYQKSAEIRVEKILFYQTKAVESLLKKAKLPSQVTISTITCLFLLLNPSMAFILLRMVMAFEIYSYINIDIPKNMELTFSLFDFNILKIIPKLISFDETSVGCKLHKKMLEKDKKCMFINNGFLQFLFPPILYLVIKMVCYLLNKNFRARSKVSDSKNTQNSPENINRRRTGLRGRNPFIARHSRRRAVRGELPGSGKENAKNSKKLVSKRGWLGSTLRFGYKKINLAFGYDLMAGMQISLHISALINLRNLTFNCTQAVINSTLALLILFFYLISAAAMLVKSCQIHSETENDKKKKGEKNISKSWKFLKNDLKKDLKIESVKHIVFYLYAKDFMVCCSVLLFMSYPLVQIAVPLIINALILSLLAAARPFQEKMSNWFRILDSASEILNLTSLLLLLIFKDKGEKSKYAYIGNLMMVLMVAVLVAYLFLSAIDTFVIFKAYFKNKKSTKKRVEPKREVGGRRQTSKVSRNKIHHSSCSFVALFSRFFPIELKTEFF